MKWLCLIILFGLISHGKKFQVLQTKLLVNDSILKKGNSVFFFAKIFYNTVCRYIFQAIF